MKFTTQAGGMATSMRMRDWLLASAAATALLAPTSAFAQDQADAENLETVEEIVVLGTPGGAGVRKQDASFAITTISDEALELASPKSTAEVFTLVPGVWAESSGGVAGANIDVRGLPGGGDAPFVTISLNGAPIYGTQTLSFLEQSTLFRVDETIQSTEALRGGPNAVFSNGEPGVTLNFRLKEGGEETEGRVKYTTSDYDLQRFDVFLSGKLAEDLYYAVGGFYRSSPGIRDAQFNSEEGHQFTAHITKQFERGKLGFFVRYTDDHGQWYLPQALNSGNDLGEFSQLGNATRFREIQVNSNGGTEVFDFSNGRGWKGFVTGVNFDYEFGDGWFIRDNASFTKGDADTYGLVPGSGAVQASEIIAARGLTGPLETVGQEVIGNDEFIQNYGHWVVLKDIESFTNDLSLSKQIDGHDITVGYYQASWSSDDWWSLGHNTPLHNVQNGDFVAGISCEDVVLTIDPTEDEPEGQCGAFGLRDAGDARVDALYAADSWQITDDFRFDVGVRHEWLDLDFSVDTGPGFPDGTEIQTNEVNDSKWAYTFAGNYDFSDDLGVFARYSKGFNFPNFDRIRDGNSSVNGIKQWEVGLKQSSDFFGLFLTGFYNKNDSFESVLLGDRGSNAFKTRSFGVEVDGRVSYENFNLGIIATLQDAEITDAEDTNIIGNRVLRQPKWQVRFAPSYDVYLGEYSATLYGAAQIVGDRFSQNANDVTLDSYTKVDLGVTFNTPFGLFAQIHADNLTDSKGLTEGDPRISGANNGRAILARSFKFSLGYDF